MMQRALTFAACAALSGCLVGPDYKRPDFYAPPTYSTDFEISQTGDRLWWRGFRDPALDAVVEKALAENQQIEAALDRLEAVNANVRATQADLFPRFDGAVSREERLFVTDPANPGQPGSGDPQEAGDTTTRIDGISRLVFSPDFFGRTRRSVEFARANRRAQIFAILDLRRAIASGVASRYIDLRRIDARTRLLEQSLELQLQTLEIVRKRRSAGLAADLDVRRAEADLARTRAQQGALMNARARAAFDLAVLLGEAPSAASDLPGRSTIPRYIAGPPIGVPAELIRRRPDVQQTEAFLIAATAEIGIETADLYPSLRIPGSVTLDLGGTIDRTELVGTISSVIDIPL
ncbi:MAG: TolC family protein, partial [Pseudomonadota bacterium]